MLVPGYGQFLKAYKCTAQKVFSHMNGLTVLTNLSSASFHITRHFLVPFATQISHWKSKSIVTRFGATVVWNPSVII